MSRLVSKAFIKPVVIICTFAGLHISANAGDGYFQGSPNYYIPQYHHGITLKVDGYNNVKSARVTQAYDKKLNPTGPQRSCMPVRPGQWQDFGAAKNFLPVKVEIFSKGMCDPSGKLREEIFLVPIDTNFKKTWWTFTRR